MTTDLWHGEVFIVRKSQKAVLVNYENEEAWIPYSQIHDDSEIYEKSDDKEGNLVIPFWLAEKNNFC